jgi:hypothetical protein
MSQARHASQNGVGRPVQHTARRRCRGARGHGGHAGGEASTARDGPEVERCVAACGGPREAAPACGGPREP